MADSKEHAREGTNQELVAVLRKLADRLEAGDEVFVTVSAETFMTDVTATGEGSELTSESDVSLGGRVPEELDPRLVLIGCIGNLIRTMNESVDLKGVDGIKALELLGLDSVKAALSKIPPNKGGFGMKGRGGNIITGGFNRG